MSNADSTPIGSSNEPNWQDRINLLQKSVSWDDDKQNINTTSNPNAIIDGITPLKSFSKVKNTSTYKKNKNTSPKKGKKHGGFKLSIPVNRGSLSFADKLAVILCNGKDSATVKDVLKEFESKGMYTIETIFKNIYLVYVSKL